jgi:hypothetical protein
MAMEQPPHPYMELAVVHGLRPLSSGYGCSLSLLAEVHGGRDPRVAMVVARKEGRGGEFAVGAGSMTESRAMASSTSTVSSVGQAHYVVFFFYFLLIAFTYLGFSPLV